MTSIRLAALTVLRAIGTFGVVRGSRWRKRRLLILCYHGFSLADEHFWNSNLYVPVEHLERRLKHLKAAGYQLLSLSEALEGLYAGTLPEDAVSVTVDDGNYDFLARGYPVFREERVPVTLYASTYHVLDSHPVFDVTVDYLLWKGRQLGRREVSLAETGGVLVLEEPGAPGAAAARLRDLAIRERWSAARKQEVLARVAAALGIDWEQFLASRRFTLMTREEIASLDPGIVDVQLHTHRHRMPDQREALLREITDNRAVLTQAGQSRDRLVHFCYPSGVHLPHHLPWLREAGITSATTCEPALASPDTDPLLLPRFIDTAITADLEFDAWCAGVRGLLRRPGWLQRSGGHPA